MARFNTNGSIAAAVKLLTFHDVRIDNDEIKCPVVDLLRNEPVATKGVFATAIDAADPSKGGVLGYATYGWGAFADRKALAKAIGKAQINPCPVYTRNQAWVEGVLVQFTPADAFTYGVDLVKIATPEGALVAEGCMLFTLPAFVAAMTGEAQEYIGITAGDQDAPQNELKAMDIVEGVKALRTGSTRSYAARSVGTGQNQRMLPAITVPALPEGGVFSTGRATVADMPAMDPYAHLNAQVQVVVPQAPTAQARSKFGAFAGTGRRGRNS